MSGSRAAYWDDQAKTYDRTTAFLEPRLFAPARQWIADRVSGRTLEVGVGTGANLPYYADRVTDLTLTDVSGAMLRAAAARAAEQGVDARLIQADSAHLDLPDDAFDTVVSTLALCCVDDELAVLRELARVLRPGGLLLMADHVESSARLGRAVQRALEGVSPRRAGEHFRRRPLLLLEPAGLELVESAASRWRLVERLSAKLVGT
ncbi:class I SAM-dependent methyltransferase [Cellulomonas humilata]|uniref:Class I SAM-dependent methyltransferase n=1 Tax=Cellulomonas humilata TaxID=144055 RepID=A0A7Y6DZE7_9CELL|nr:class I SAM-dependent methyltransferase [Cellulomonas humilata]NUU19420.1 class I SAM-dependent methyltransferase [Cellulomonas humilata]